MTSPLIDFDEIRKEVALRHGIVLGVDDPILVTVTINELVLARIIEVADEQQRRSAEDLARQVRDQVAEATELSSRVIMNSAQQAAAHIQHVADDVRTQMELDVRKQIADAQIAAVRNSEGFRVPKTVYLLVAFLLGVAIATSAAGLFIGFANS